MGGYLLVKDPLGFDHLNKAYITSPFFIICSLISFYTFGLKNSLKTFKNIRSITVWIIVINVAFFFTPLVLNQLIGISKQTVDKLMEIKFYYPLFVISTSITKLSDILFQQSLVVALVLFLKEKMNNDIDIIKSFTFIFFVLHLPLFFYFKLSALIFIIPSLLAGMVFSFLILKFKYGVVYSMLIHQGFYILTGLIFRLI